MSYSDDKTEKALHTLQKKIVKEFGQAYKDLSETARIYFEKLEIRDEKYKQGLLDGTIMPPAGQTIEQHYKEWRTAQIGRGKRWEALRDDMARRLTQAQEQAAAYINDTTPGIYSLNANFEAYQIEQLYDGIAFNIVDEQTVKRLLGKNKQLYPKRTIDVPKEQKWNNKKLQSSLLQGIIQGKSIKKIARDFDQVAQMGARSAVRAARTAVTGAQNAGRQETYNRATDMGIEIEKEWISAHDTRTRDSHRMLDGIRVPYNKAFPNGLQYPGDFSVNIPSELWNCRCTMGAVFPGITDEARKVQWIDEHGNVKAGTRNKDASEYEKWYNNKINKQGPYTHADATAKALGEKENKPAKTIKKSVSDAAQRVLDKIKTEGLKYNDVKSLKVNRTADEIIKAVGGGDRTQGSCASLALVYVAQKLGLDVLDFRGGKDGHWFAIRTNRLNAIASVGMTHTIESARSSTTAGKKLIKMVKNGPVGKEYVFTCGRHSAVIKKDTDGLVKYLELQTESNNGWIPFDDSGSVLKRRFLETKPISRMSPDVQAILTDYETITDEEGFRQIMGYINTSEDKQKKGYGGYAK